jgi:hypothetical protein
MSSRENCAYEYISDAFKPTEIAYYVAYTGFDAFGYPYQRILPTLAVKDELVCLNNGVKIDEDNRCVCTPGLRGKGF